MASLLFIKMPDYVFRQLMDVLFVTKNNEVQI